MCLVYKERSRAAPCAGNVSMSARVYNVPKLGAIKSGRTFLGAHPSSSVTPSPFSTTRQTGRQGGGMSHGKDL